jgi:hypothetical protein
MKRLLVVLFGLAPALAAAPPAWPLWSRLDEQQVNEAVSQGTAVYERWRREGGAIDDTDPEYVVHLGPEIGRATLFTGFSTVALETRRWLAIGRTLTSKDLETVVDEFRGRVRFSVVLLGSNRNFMRHYSVQLVQGAESRAPLEGAVFRGVQQTSSGRWLAQGQYTFDVKGLDLTGRCSLVLQDQGGKPLRFDFDLARLR